MRSAGNWVARVVGAAAVAFLFWVATLGFEGAWPYGAANWTVAWLENAKPARETVDRRRKCTQSIRLFFLAERHGEPYSGMTGVLRPKDKSAATIFCRFLPQFFFIEKGGIAAIGASAGMRT